jgi:hypothetical protein
MISIRSLRGKRHKAGGVIYIENKQERAGVPVLEALVFSCEQNRGVRGRTWDGGGVGLAVAHSIWFSIFLSTTTGCASRKMFYA